MAVEVDILEISLNSMRERTVRLEQEAAALRSALDEMALLVSWQASRSVSADTLQKIAVSENEVASYRRLVDGQFPDPVLRLALQAQKAATHLKRSVPPVEREAAVDAIIDALHQAAAALNLTIPDELEATIGD
jgi:hypothetical protein